MRTRLLLSAAVLVAFALGLGLVLGRCSAQPGRGGVAPSPADEPWKVQLPRGFEVDARTDGGWQVLQWAAQNGELAIVRELVEKGVAYDRPDHFGHTALHTAVLLSRPQVVRLLLAKGADPDAVDQAGDSLLHSAAVHDHVAIVRFLLDFGADTGALDARGQSALHIAAACGRAEVAELLVASGADTAARDKEGRTPLDLARTSRIVGAEDVAKLLAPNGAPQ